MVEADWPALLRPLLDGVGFVAPIVAVVPLTGGVSSDIVRVDLADGATVCAKRALARLKVASVWEAPLERNHYEVAWLRLAASIVPGIAPRVLGEDREKGIALLEFLPPDEYVLWKTDLLAGRFNRNVSDSVAAALARIHAATWKSSTAERDFATDQMFDALRLSPYLRTLADRIPDLAPQILSVIEATARTKLALVHGDVSPKNILVSRINGHPVLLDAECAWFGDPAFDAAFCMNHLLLKAVHVPSIRADLVAASRGFCETWLAGIPAQERADTGARLAHLLPCLLLARVDGKSPVEYLGESERMLVRALARPLIATPSSSVAELLTRFETSLIKQDL